MADILLIRHGENDYTRKGKLAGWTPGVHLNEKGRAQAQATAVQLAEAPIKAIYSSPLERALETAQPLARATALRVQRLEGVGEVRYGDWTGKSLKALMRTKLWRTVQRHPATMQFPQGETFRAVQSRAVDALETLVRKHSKQWVAVFSHGDVIKLLLTHYLGMPIDMFQRIVISTGSISHLRLMGGMPFVLKINEQPALPDTKQESNKPNHRK
ncbi:MAG TPA: MSMEG_4193 family putative phosphomutase [Anaerolineales bacterium]|nr:MSMEG_4193 family putative phosphomutase [Anaerolineales bacterium]